jgi:SAM-dependent methyltransferase
MKPYMSVVVDILNEIKPHSVLDVPSGSGCLQPMLHFEHSMDGIDLFEKKPPGYQNFIHADLDSGLPNDLGQYEAIVSCEGIEHIGNPLQFLESMKDHLLNNGTVIITTPNVWFPSAKIKYFLNGFFPSFPCLAGKIQRGTHMHITPWSYPQLFLYMKLVGFSDIRLHSVEEKKPKYLYEYFLGLPQRLYCKNKRNKSQTDEEALFWKNAGSHQSVYGRRLVVSATYRK